MPKKNTPPPTSNMPRAAGPSADDELAKALGEMDNAALADGLGDGSDADLNAALADGLGDGKAHDPLADPLADVKYTGKVEPDSVAELTELQKKFRENAKKEQEGYELSNDSEFWFCVTFQTRDQKEAFLRAMDWFKHGDKYLDGQWVARKQGVTIPPAPPNLAYYLREERTDAKMAALPTIGDETVKRTGGKG